MKKILVLVLLLLILGSVLALEQGVFGIGYERDVWRCDQDSCEEVKQGNFSTGIIEDQASKGIFAKNVSDDYYYFCQDNSCSKLQDGNGLTDCVRNDIIQLGGMFCLAASDREIFYCSTRGCEKYVNYPGSTDQIITMAPSHDGNLFFRMDNTNIYSCTFVAEFTGKCSAIVTNSSFTFLKPNGTGGVIYGKRAGSDYNVSQCNGGSCGLIKTVSGTHKLYTYTDGVGGRNVLKSCSGGSLCNTYYCDSSTCELVRDTSFLKNDKIAYVDNGNFYALEGNAGDRNLLNCNISTGCERVMYGRFQKETLIGSGNVAYILDGQNKLFSCQGSFCQQVSDMNLVPESIVESSVGVIALNEEMHLVDCGPTNCTIIEDTVRFFPDSITNHGSGLVYLTDSESDMWRCLGGSCKQISAEPFYGYSLTKVDHYVTVPYACSGIVQKNTTLCSGDASGLTEATENSFVDVCTSEKKCEYVCATGYRKIPFGCVKGEEDEEYGIFIVDKENDMWRCTKENCKEIFVGNFVGDNTSDFHLVDNQGIIYSKSLDGNLFSCDDDGCTKISTIDFGEVIPNFDSGVYATNTSPDFPYDENVWQCNEEACSKTELPERKYSWLLPVSQNEFFTISNIYQHSDPYNNYYIEYLDFCEGKTCNNLAQHGNINLEDSHRVIYDSKKGVYRFEITTSSSNWSITSCTEDGCDGALKNGDTYFQRFNETIPNGTILGSNGGLNAFSLGGYVEFTSDFTADIYRGEIDQKGNLFLTDLNGSANNIGLRYCTPDGCGGVITRGVYPGSITLDFNGGIFAIESVDENVIHCTTEKCESIFNGQTFKNGSLTADNNGGIFLLKGNYLWHCNTEGCKEIYAQGNGIYFNSENRNNGKDTLVSDFNGGVYTLTRKNTFIPEYVMYCDSNHCSILGNDVEFNGDGLIRAFQKPIPADVPPSDPHLECHNDACVIIDGFGENECIEGPIGDAYCTTQHRECVGIDCNLISGIGEDTCYFDVTCNTPENPHLECRNGDCALIQTEGPNECDAELIDDPFCLTKHRDCSAQLCLLVDGVHEDLCTLNNDCELPPEDTHLKCLGNDCVEVIGEGTDECDPAQLNHPTCMASHRECSPSGNCDLVGEAGTDECQEDTECSATNINNIIDFVGTYDGLGKTNLNTKCNYSVNGEAEIIVSLASEEITKLSGQDCLDIGNAITLEKDLNAGTTYEVTLTIPQPCDICSRTIYLLATDKNKENINIPDNNISSIIIVLLIVISVLFLNKKERRID